MAITLVRTNGQKVEKRILAGIDDAYRASGLDPAKYRVVTQGSYSDGSLSAKIHTGNGVVDLRVWNIPADKRLKLVLELRRRGFCAWLRSAKYGWTKGDHIHLVDRYASGLADGAKRQVVDYDLKRNGLANHASDPQPRPPKQYRWPWPTVELTNIGVGKVNSDVLRVQQGLHEYVGLDYSSGVKTVNGVTVGRWGPLTVDAWRRAEVKSGKRGLALLIFLGDRYGWESAGR